MPFPDSKTQYRWLALSLSLNLERGTSASSVLYCGRLYLLYIVFIVIDQIVSIIFKGDRDCIGFQAEFNDSTILDML